MRAHVLENGSPYASADDLCKIVRSGKEFQEYFLHGLELTYLAINLSTEAF